MQKTTQRADLREEQQNTLALLYERYYAQMYQKAYTVLRNHQDAEDAVQEAFYRVCLNAEVFADPISKDAAALICVYTRNVVFNFYRKNRRRNALLLNQADTGWLQDAREYELALLMINQENAEAVRRAVDALEPHYREVIRLKYYENKKNIEIAAQLGLGVNVVNGRIYRAKNVLRELLWDSLADGFIHP